MVVCFGLVAVMLFGLTALPLEAKTLALVLLRDEARQQLGMLNRQAGDFQLTLVGEGLYQQRQCKLERIFIITPLILVFRVTTLQRQRTFFISQDSLQVAADYRHLSRILLYQK